MGINYGDNGLIVNYIQMFLRKYYSKFIGIEHEYSSNVQNNIINYINSPDSVTMIELCNNILPLYNKYLMLLQYFNKEEKIDEVYFESRLTNSEINGSSVKEIIREFPLSTISETNKDLESKNSVEWIYKYIRDFESYILNYGWRIDNFNYNNKRNRCDITIKKINENVLPKSSLIDLINTFDKKYTEICFATSDKDDKIYFSTLYNFEIKNNEVDGEKYSLFLPSISDDKYEVIRLNNGTYNVIKNYDENNPIIEEFTGLTTFTSNIYSYEEDQYYIIYIKRPINKLSTNNELFAYINLSKDIGTRMKIDYSSNVYNRDEVESIDNIFDTTIKLDNDNPNYTKEDELFYICLVKIPPVTSNDYKLCISLYDPNNEINTILSFKLDKDYLNNISIYENSENKLMCWQINYDDLCPLNNHDKYNKALSKVNFIDPYSYYLSPYVLHDKFISYILEAIVHDYSKEEDIILIQKICNRMGFSYDLTEEGYYSDDLKEFITDIQNSFTNKEGNPVLYGKGYTDPDTESIINLYGGAY